MERKFRRRPRSIEGGIYNVYEREILRDLHRGCRTGDKEKMVCKSKSTNRIARDTETSWQTTKNYLNSLYEKGLITKKESKKKTLWKINI